MVTTVLSIFLLFLPFYFSSCPVSCCLPSSSAQFSWKYCSGFSGLQQGKCTLLGVI